MDISRFKAIAFDADDTLWENETLFRTAEDRFCALMRPFLPEEDCQKALFSVEMKNLPLYGYGIKPFGLSLIESAISLSQGRASNALIQDILAIVKDMLSAENPLESKLSIGCGHKRRFVGPRTQARALGIGSVFSPHRGNVGQKTGQLSKTRASS